MLVDSSAWIAILLRESDHEIITAKVRGSKLVCITAPGLFETVMAAVGKIGPQGNEEVQAMLRLFNVQIVPFGADAADVAINAFLRYGKGRKHPAQLNYGDCISYAVSKCEVMPLLFKGDDFRKTDVECAI
jgi:ribonuclease VapC